MTLQELISNNNPQTEGYDDSYKIQQPIIVINYNDVVNMDLLKTEMKIQVYILSHNGVKSCAPIVSE